MLEKRETSYVVCGNVDCAAIVENSVEVPQKLKMKLPYEPVIPFLIMYPRKPKTLIQKNICTSMFIAALFTIVKNGGNPSAHQ